MTRLTESQLLDFCAQQRGALDPARWAQFSIVNRDELAAAALFLAGVDWFGHKEPLRQIAEELLPDRSCELSELVRDIGFDCARFSNMLRRKLEQRPDVRATAQP